MGRAQGELQGLTSKKAGCSVARPPACPEPLQLLPGRPARLLGILAVPLPAGGLAAGYLAPLSSVRLPPVHCLLQFGWNKTAQETQLCILVKLPNFPFQGRMPLLQGII